MHSWMGKQAVRCTVIRTGFGFPLRKKLHTFSPLTQGGGNSGETTLVFATFQWKSLKIVTLYHGLITASAFRRSTDRQPEIGIEIAGRSGFKIPIFTILSLNGAESSTFVQYSGGWVQA